MHTYVYLYIWIYIHMYIIVHKYTYVQGIESYLPHGVRTVVAVANERYNAYNMHSCYGNIRICVGYNMHSCYDIYICLFIYIHTLWI
jgi:hypothetical protein